MNIYYWGDSLTRGQLGYTFIPACRPGDVCRNFGKNGDTVYGIFKRLFAFLETTENREGVYVVAAGTNDLLLQYKRKASFLWRLRALGAMPRKRPAKDVRAFEQLYRNGIKQLTARVSHIVLVGIPYFEIEDFPQETIRRYNAVIAQIAADYGLPFVDCYNIQTQLMGQSVRHFCKHSFTGVALTTAAMKLRPGIKERLSSWQHLSVTVDGVHLNKQSAMAIGKAVEQKLCDMIGAD
ncbi:MAG: SGNH/GDSL hydrolase family protein [Peptococcaceae bacterium]|nr:SGNH/GDSL hydrolase family protein [Peptococcaceae bacterium]